MSGVRGIAGRCFGNGLAFPSATWFAHGLFASVFLPHCPLVDFCVFDLWNGLPCHSHPHAFTSWQGSVFDSTGSCPGPGIIGMSRRGGQGIRMATRKTANVSMARRTTDSNPWPGVPDPSRGKKQCSVISVTGQPIRHGRRIACRHEIHRRVACWGNHNAWGIHFQRFPPKRPVPLDRLGARWCDR